MDSYNLDESNNPENTQDNMDNYDNSNLLNTLESLQTNESNILNNISNEAVKTTPNFDRITELNNDLKPIQELRIKLMKQLNNDILRHQQNSKVNSKKLHHNYNMINMGEEQLRQHETNIQRLIDEKNNTKRMIQITSYENSRLESHKFIFKVIAFGSLLLLGTLFIGDAPIFSMIKNALIVIICLVMSYFIIKELIWNAYRSPMDWDEFNWYGANTSSSHDSIWQHDVNALTKMKDDAYGMASNKIDKGEQYVEGKYNNARSDLTKFDSTMQNDITSISDNVLNNDDSNDTDNDTTGMSNDDITGITNKGTNKSDDDDKEVKAHNKKKYGEPCYFGRECNSGDCFTTGNDGKDAGYCL